MKPMLALKPHLKLFLIASLTVGLSLGLSACQTLPLGSMMKLGNPMELNPAEVRFAVRGPAVLHLREQDFKITIKYEHPSLPKGLERTYSFEKEALNPLPKALQADLQAGETAEIYGFAPETVKALRQLQQEMQTHQQQGNPGKGSISVSLASGCKTGAISEGPLYVGIYTQIHSQEGFFELMPKLDLRQVLAANGVSGESIPDCKN